MSQGAVLEFPAPAAIDDALTDLLKNGPEQLIEQAFEVELAEFLEQNVRRRDEQRVPAGAGDCHRLAM